jgi:D-alanyl-D-alanine carboxypeptidase
MRMKDYQFAAPTRTVTLHNTNHLVGTDVDVRGGKTGFISKSGYCLATLLRLPQGEQVAVVVLGARSNPGRFWETRHLFNWLAGKTPALLATQTQTPGPPNSPTANEATGMPVAFLRWWCHVACGACIRKGNAIRCATLGCGVTSVPRRPIHTQWPKPHVRESRHPSTRHPRRRRPLRPRA